MTTPDVQSGYADVNGAKLYYEIAGQGDALVLVHAGVADCRMWDGQFAEFAQHYRTLRFDMRGFGKSEPVEGEYTNRADLCMLLKHLEITRSALIGCSMGGGTCLDFTLQHPERVSSLVMVGSAPTGLEIDVPMPALFAEIEKADAAKDWDLLAELETQLWFDGEGRTPDQVDPEARQLALEMNRLAIEHAAKAHGQHQPPIQPSAAERLDELHAPLLVIYGDRDTAYIQQASSYLEQHIPNAKRVLMPNTAHLPNMERPAEFNQIVLDFLQH